MKKIQSRTLLIIYMLFTINIFGFSQDADPGETEAKQNMEKSLLQFKSGNDNLNVSEDSAKTYKIMEGKSLRLKITLFMMSMYGIIVTGENKIKEIKVEVFDEDNKLIHQQKITGNKSDALLINAEYTGEYVVQITPTKIEAGKDDFYKLGWISWAVLYDEF